MKLTENIPRILLLCLLFWAALVLLLLLALGRLHAAPRPLRARPFTARSPALRRMAARSGSLDDTGDMP